MALTALSHKTIISVHITMEYAIEAAQVTFVGGVPTIWLGVGEHDVFADPEGSNLLLLCLATKREQCLAGGDRDLSR